MADTDPFADTFENLDLDKLTLLITILKDNEVPYFRFGVMEVGLPPQEPEVAIGFGQLDKRAGAQAAKADADKPVETDSHVPPHYKKAFGNRPVPNFKPREVNES